MCRRHGEGSVKGLSDFVLSKSREAGGGGPEFVQAVNSGVFPGHAVADAGTTELAGTQTFFFQDQAGCIGLFRVDVEGIGAILKPEVEAAGAVLADEFAAVGDGFFLSVIGVRNPGCLRLVKVAQPAVALVVHQPLTNGFTCLVRIVGRKTFYRESSGGCVILESGIGSLEEFKWIHEARGCGLEVHTWEVSGNFPAKAP